MTAAQRRDRLKERDRLGEQARKLQAEGKPDEAIKAAEAMLKIENGEVLGDVNDDVAGSLEWLGQLHKGREDWPGARGVLGELALLPPASTVPTTGGWPTARGSLADIERVAVLSVKNRRRLVEAGRLEKEADRLENKGHAREAIETDRRALAIREEVLGPNHPDTATSLFNLAGPVRGAGGLRCRPAAV